jgi:hypothetical protein
MKWTVNGGLYSPPYIPYGLHTDSADSIRTPYGVQVDWGILRMAVSPAKEPLGVRAESIQTPHKFTRTLGLCSDKSEHFLVDSD